MGEKSSVLLQNEKQANKAVAKVMRFTFLFFTLVYLLNVFGIFIVDMKIMTIAYIVGSVFLWIPTLVVKVAGDDSNYIKYIMIFCAVIFVTVNSCTLGYHVIVLYIYAIAIASLYFSKKVNILTIILTVIGVSFGQWFCFSQNVFSDKNFTSLYELVVYGMIPRALILISIAAIFTMLCERTAGILSNLLDAEAQEKMMNEMQQLREKSKQTSDELFHVVKELSVITETFMKTNEQVSEESTVIMHNFGKNTDEINGMNSRTHDINEQLIALGKMNEQISQLSVEINNRTADNQKKMDNATNSMQQIYEKTSECKDIIWNLGEESKKILGIIDVITGISKQTNILALNASIEAARAGEHGKGFAVVASEIQKLAEQTQNAVEDIGKIVNETVCHTEDAVNVMEKSVELTENGMDSVHDVESSTAVITGSNREMADHIEKMDRTVENIREQSNEVAKGMEQVNQNTKDNYSAIEHVTAETQKNTAGIEEIERMVERITVLAEQAVSLEQ